MKTNHVLAKLKRGEASVGTWLSLADPMAARLMARAGFDWLNVDLEHSPANFETAAACFALIAGEGAAPLARVPSNSIENIKRVLDSGAWGVIVPMVNSAAEARAAVEAARYAPLGARSIGGQLHGPSFNTTPAEYYEKANGEILVAVQAEHVSAIAALDEIAAVAGIDAIFVGPNDLLSSLGQKPGFDSDDTRFNEALGRVVAVARKHGLAPGIHSNDAALARKRIQQGFQLVAVSSDLNMMTGKANELLKEIRTAGKR